MCNRSSERCSAPVHAACLWVVRWHGFFQPQDPCLTIAFVEFGRVWGTGYYHRPSATRALFGLTNVKSGRASCVWQENGFSVAIGPVSKATQDYPPLAPPELSRNVLRPVCGSVERCSIGSCLSWQTLVASLGKSADATAPGGALARQARTGHAPGIFFDPCPTGDPLGGALSAVQLFGRLAVLEPHTL